MGLLNDYYTKTKKTNPYQTPQKTSSSSGGLLTQYQKQHKLSSPFEAVKPKPVAQKTTVKVTLQNKSFFDQLADINNYAYEKAKVGVKSALATAQTHLGVLREANREQAENLRGSMTGNIGPKAEAQNKQIIQKGREKQVKIQKEREKLGKAERIKWLAGEIAEATPQMISSLGLGFVASVVTKNPALGVSLGFGSSYAQTTGGLYQDIKELGVDDKKARDAALTGGATSALIEQLPLGKALSRLPQGQQIKKQIVKEVTKTIATQGAIEGSTESIQQIVENATRKVFNENQELLEGVPESFLIGGIMGGAAGGVLDTSVAIFSGDPKKTIEKANQEIEKAIKTDPDKRTPRQQQIVKTLSITELTPQQAISLVAKDPTIKNTIDGNTVIKTAIQAQKEGKNLVVDFTKEGEVNIDIVEKNQAVVGAEEANLAASSSESVGEPNMASNESGRSIAETNLPSEKTSTNNLAEPPTVTRNTSPSKRTSFVKEFSMTEPSQEEYTKYFSSMQAAEKPLLKSLNQVSQEVEGEVVYRMKSQESLDKKLKKRAKFAKQKGEKPRTLADMNDTLGATIIVDSVNKLDQVLETAKINMDIKKVDNFRQNPTMFGYTAIHLDVEVDNGAIAEVQVNTKEGLYQKEWAHEIYEKWRQYIENNGATTPQDILNALERSGEENKFAEFYKDLLLSQDIYAGKVKIPQKYIDAVNKRLAETKRKIEGKEEKDSAQAGLYDADIQPRVDRVFDAADRFLEQLDESPPKAIYLVGSRSKGKAGDTSDWDFIVHGDDFDNVEAEKIRQLEDGVRLNGLSLDVDINKRANHNDIIFSSKEPTDGIKIWDEKQGYIPQSRVAQPSDTKPEKRETTPSKEEPVGTGRIKNSRLYERIVETAEAELKAELEKNKVTYNVLDLKKQAEAVPDIIENDPERAVRIARGLEEPPRGITQNAMALGLAELARSEGDYATAGSLWTATSLRSTRAGQEIVSLRGQMTDTDPINYVKQVVHLRVERLARVYNTVIEKLNVKEDATSNEKVQALVKHRAQEVKKQLTQRQKKIQSAQEIIDMLRCK